MIGRIRSALERFFAGERRSIPASSDPEPEAPSRQPMPSDGATGIDDVDGIPAFLRRKPPEATTDDPMPSRSERFTTFLQAMESDPAARARFAADPEAVLADLGIDSAPYNLHPAMSDMEINQLVAAWKNISMQPGRVDHKPDLIKIPEPAVMTVIYGPPPGRSR